MFSNKKIGGIRFVRLFNLSLTISVAKNRAHTGAIASLAAAATFAASGIGAALITIAAR